MTSTKSLVSGRDGALFAAWVTSLLATGSALFIGEVMGQTPCDLCWFQRAFMFPLAVVLGVGVLVGDGTVWRYAVPLSLIGGAIAAYHSLLYADIISEPIRPCTASGPSCTDAAMVILGIPIPYLSLVAFATILCLISFAGLGRTR